MSVKHILFFLIIVKSCNIFGQLKADTLPNYLFLENRLGDCNESVNFMKFHVQPSSKYKKYKQKYKRSHKYEVQVKLKFDENRFGITDLDRFYIDISCFSSCGICEVLNIFATPDLERELLSISYKAKKKDTLIFHFKLENTDGFLLKILNKEIIESSWYSNTRRDGKTNLNRSIYRYDHDTLPSRYILHNRVVDCDESYKFMQNVIFKIQEAFKTPFPNDNFEKTNVEISILNDKTSYKTNDSNQTTQYVEFFIDLECLKNEPLARVLLLFLTEEQTSHTISKIESLKDTEYTLVLKINVKYLDSFSIRVERGKISAIGWGIIKESHK